MTEDSDNINATNEPLRAPKERGVQQPGGETAFGPAYRVEFFELLDGSPAIRAVRKIIESIADTDATVLLRGESGVGKDVVARAIHAASKRHQAPFVKVNCAAIPEGLLESELFGHERGAFTGAHRRRPGQFEYANKGTIYLDEIAELPLALQPKILHVLQDHAFSRVGGQGAIDSDVRVIAATNRNLESALQRGDFREDLYYRLNVVEIIVPPLRQRKEEIPLLAIRFLERFNRQYGRTKELTSDTMKRFMDYDWPGNVREFENVIRRMVVLTDAQFTLQSRAVHASATRATSTPIVSESLRDIARNGAREAERRALGEVLERTRWNRAEAARVLKVSYKTLLNKISECELKPPPENN